MKYIIEIKEFIKFLLVIFIWFLPCFAVLYLLFDLITLASSIALVFFFSWLLFSGIEPILIFSLQAKKLPLDHHHLDREFSHLLKDVVSCQNVEELNVFVFDSYSSWLPEILIFDRFRRRKKVTLLLEKRLLQSELSSGDREKLKELLVYYSVILRKRSFSSIYSFLFFLAAFDVFGRRIGGWKKKSFLLKQLKMILYSFFYWPIQFSISFLGRGAKIQQRSLEIARVFLADRANGI